VAPDGAVLAQIPEKNADPSSAWQDNFCTIIYPRRRNTGIENYYCKTTGA